MRERIIAIVVHGAFLLIVIGLLFTQVLRYGYYAQLSKNNAIRIIPIDGPRGTIFDRNGVPLVSSRLAFNVVLVYHELDDRRALAKLLKESLGLTGQQIIELLEKAAKQPFLPTSIAEDVPKEKAIMIEEAGVDIPGVRIETRSIRDYLMGRAGCHVFGYLGEVTETELDTLEQYGFRARDFTGRSGLEKFYNLYLRGSDGGVQIEVDNRGRQKRVLGVKEPSPGKDLYLTIDNALQKRCDQLLGDRKGAVIVLDPRTGEVLAFASHPGFDPNIFVRSDQKADRVRVLTDRVGKPLFNRAISGTYPPGSVFKVVTSSAALETKKISPQTSFSCTGAYHLGRAVFKCWKDGGHGLQNLRSGIMNSCDVYFYSIGRLAGADAIEEYARRYGYGARTGIDLPDEAKGTVPGRAWKRTYRHDAWYEGDTVNFSIGQGFMLTTPLQAVVMMSAVANNGKIVRPYLVKRIDATSLVNPDPKPLGVADTTLKRIQEGLYDVVNAEGGTGRRARAVGVVAAGKTGTAENPHGRPHAWFSGYAPYTNPKICVVVFVEQGGHGGVEPADIAHGIFDEAKAKGYL